MIPLELALKLQPRLIRAACKGFAVCSPQNQCVLKECLPRSMQELFLLYLF
uniref:Uncharacterized protein n=1 Tax=Triticum urartu TaxID=4572 RepID=A0A8R7Q0N0_TRIUA